MSVNSFFLQIVTDFNKYGTSVHVNGNKFVTKNLISTVIIETSLFTDDVCNLKCQQNKAKCSP